MKDFIFNHNLAAQSMASPTVNPLLLFAGLFIKSSRIPIYFFWIKYLSWLYYSIENIFIGQWTFYDTFVCTPDAATRNLMSIQNMEKQFLGHELHFCNGQLLGNRSL